MDQVVTESEERVSESPNNSLEPDLVSPHPRISCELALGWPGGSASRLLGGYESFQDTVGGDAMTAKRTAAKDIDEYVAGFPKDVQAILQKIRTTIRKAAPDAEETVSYQIPTFTLKGHYLIYFAAYQKHVSLYPAPRGVKDFKQELSAYKGGKGTVRFPLDKPVPFGLISRIVKYRVEENLDRAKTKGKK